VENLKLGISYDYLGVSSQPLTQEQGFGNGTLYLNAIALYGAFQATEKLSLHLRAEEIWGGVAGTQNAIYAVTTTAQYDLWQNVLTRVEFRWDHVEHGTLFGNGNQENAVMLAANVIYRF
jgi:hypothetical protein